MQTRFQSFVEKVVDQSISFIIGYMINFWILPFVFNTKSSHAQAIGLTLFFTVVSFVRGYYVRRLFNKWQGKDSKHENKG